MPALAAMATVALSALVLLGLHVAFGPEAMVVGIGGLALGALVLVPLRGGKGGKFAPQPPKPPTLNGKRLSDLAAVVMGAALAFWIGWTAMHAFVEAIADLPVMEARR